MRQVGLALMLTLLVAGCSNVRWINESGLCDGLNPLVDDLVTSVLVDGGPKTVVSTDRFVSGYDAGCGNDL